MVLIDLNQIMIAAIMQNIKQNELTALHLIRHMVLKSIRSYAKEYRDYGTVVLCCDSHHYWRRDRFPNYKLHRRAERQESAHDWDFFHQVFSSLKQEFKESLPYKFIDVDGAEADDVIASLAKTYHDKERILIISSDKDFLQLQKYANVFQYSPTQKKFLKEDNPEAFLKEHIIRGDRGDGIPNILSDDDVIMEKRKQSSITTKNVTKWLQEDYTSFCDDEMRPRYFRNQELIDFEFIPKDIQAHVVEQYERQIVPSKTKLLVYLIDKRLQDLMQTINEF